MLRGHILIVRTVEKDASGYLPINDVKVNSDHLRKNPVNINYLKSTISDVGLLQPILVRKAEGSYIVIDGERRLRAMKELGISELIVGREVIIDADETVADARFKQVIANIQREDINPIDLGHAFLTLKQKHGYQYKEIAEIIGKTPHYVTSKVGLAKRLDPDVQDMVAADWYASKCIQDTFLEDDDPCPYEMNIKIIEDIARLPFELQKTAYVSIKSRELGYEDALTYIRALKKQLGEKDLIGQQPLKESASSGDDVGKYVEKINRDVDMLVIKFESAGRPNDQDMISKLEMAMEKLSLLYSRLKSDSEAGGDRTESKATV